MGSCLCRIRQCRFKRRHIFVECRYALPQINRAVIINRSVTRPQSAKLNFSIKVPTTIERSLYLGNSCLMGIDVFDVGTYFDRSCFRFSVATEPLLSVIVLPRGLLGGDNWLLNSSMGRFGCPASGLARMVEILRFVVTAILASLVRYMICGRAATISANIGFFGIAPDVSKAIGSNLWASEFVRKIEV